MARPRRRARTEVGRLIEEGLKGSDIPSIQALERLLNLPSGQLSHIMSGRIKRPRETVVRQIARALHQDIESYHLAQLADSDELPTWHSVLDRQLGIHLLPDEVTALEAWAEFLCRHRRDP